MAARRDLNWTKIFQFWGFIDPYDQNEHYKAMLSKILIFLSNKLWDYTFNIPLISVIWTNILTKLTISTVLAISLIIITTVLRIKT